MFTNGILATGSIIAFLLIIEFGLRITGLQSAAPNPPKIYQHSDNPEISYELIPNLQEEPAYRATVSTDEHGFRRNGKWEIGNRKFIAVLGDSIAFGHGVNDNQTLSSQLAKQLHYQLINAAVPGYQLTQEAAMYREKVAPLHPDGVMLVFYWNDINAGPAGILDDKGILRGHNWSPEDDVCQPITEGILGLLPGRCWLDTHSAFYKAFKKLMNLKASKNMQEQERTETPAMEPFTEDALDAYIQELQTLAPKLPKDRWFVIWPDNFEHREARKTLSDAARRYGFTVIDLYEHFGNNVETLSWDTVHPSPLSLQSAAQYIVPLLYSGQ